MSNLLPGLLLLLPSLYGQAEQLAKTPYSLDTPYGLTLYNLDTNYAQTPWPAGHRDAANSDYVPLLMSKKNHIAKHLLQGHPVFWAPTSGLHGRYFVTSGKGQGHSNLHAFDADGNLLWKSAAQQSLNDLDGWAIINAPIVAANGDVYVGDQNQLWAFHPDGRVKWVSDLKPHGVSYGFMSAVISQQGYVGGISSNGKVVFFKAENGELALPVLDLPGGDGPSAQDKPPADLWKGLMDETLKPIMFNLIQGWEMEVANTPAIHPRSGRIYITAYGTSPGTGLLYGIDVQDDHLEIAFQSEMGQGSGTSPAISHNGERVYALDEAGHMIAIDADTGQQVWKSDLKGGGAASPSVGADESIYTLFQDHLIGFDYDGTVRFQKSYNALCAQQIEAPGWFWGLFLSRPVAFLDSLLTVDAGNNGWMNVVCGYHIKLLVGNSERTLVPIPKKSLVVSVNLHDGEPDGSVLAIPETSEGFILPLANGNQFVTLSGAISSIFYHSLNRFLPDYLAVPFEPKAGVLLVQPNARLSLLQRQLQWMDIKMDESTKAFTTGSIDESRQLLAQLQPFIETGFDVLKYCAREGELNNEQSSRVLSLYAKLHQTQLSMLRSEQPDRLQYDEMKELMGAMAKLIDSVEGAP